MYYELYHHGIKNQTWGNRNGPPYPLSRLVSNAIKKKKNVAEAKKKAEEKKKKAEEKKKKAEEKERVLKEGTATEVLQYIGELSNQEISDALNRIKWTNQLKDISKKEQDAGWKNVDDVMKKVGNVKDWGKTGIELIKVLDEAMKMANRDSNNKNK